MYVSGHGIQNAVIPMTGCSENSVRHATFVRQVCAGLGASLTSGRDKTLITVLDVSEARSWGWCLLRGLLCYVH